MFGNRKKIKELQKSLDKLEFDLQSYKSVRDMEFQHEIDRNNLMSNKIASEIKKEIKQDVDLINFKLDNQKPHQMGEIKSGEHKGWIVIGSEVREQRGWFNNDILGYTWETKIVNKKGETKII